EQLRDELLADFEQYNKDWYINELERIEEYYEYKKLTVEQESKIKRLKAKNPELVEDAIYKRREELDSIASREKLMAGKISEQRKQTVSGNLKYFTVGKRLVYPNDLYAGETLNIM